MSKEDDIPQSVKGTLEAMRGENKNAGYGLGGRLILFFSVTAIGTAIAFGIWIQSAVGVGMSAGSNAGGSALYLIPGAWLAGIIALGVLVFRK